MRRLLSALTLFAALAAPAAAGGVLDESTAERWKPQVGWVSRAPAEYSVASQAGSLVFRAEGADAELPWTLTLRDDETVADARYVVVEYLAYGLSSAPGNYFLHGWEGTAGGRTLMPREDLEADGTWHTLATDLMALEPEGDVTQLAVKVTVGGAGSARLVIRSIRFADTLPAGAVVSRVVTPPRESLTVDWDALGAPVPQPAWATHPASDFSTRREGAATTFTVRGAGRQMRWPIALEEPVDLERLTHVSVRYRATGAVGRGGYTLWLGDSATGDGGHSTIALSPSSLQTDGLWHTFTTRVDEPFVATQIAVGLDCDAGEATVTLGPIVFSSTTPRWPVAQLLPHEVREAPWPAGQEGWTALGGIASSATPTPLLASRLALEDWFAAEHITVAEIPFEVPATAGEAPQTGTASLGEATVALPPDAREVYLLVGAVAPPTEPFGIDAHHPRTVEYLTEPEKVVLEIRYAEGPPDLVQPIDLATGRWGMRRGLAVAIAHPDPARAPTGLALRDGMRSASFALLGATVRSDAPRVPEPTWQGLAYALPPAGALGRLAEPPPSQPGSPAVVSGKLSARFALGLFPSLSALGAGDDGAHLTVDSGPVFEVEVAGEVLAAADWRFVEAVPEGEGWRIAADHAGTSLRATVTCRPGADNRLILGMTLANRGATPVTATVRFPVLRGVRMGSAEETWYLVGRRGGIVSNAPVSFREGLGEPHPLQVDGFFNPADGLALACMTHDTVGQHHFLRLAKDATGGAWMPEYVQRDLAPGASFSATETELALLEGDWRAIFGAYREWLATWYRPPADKPWWERTFTFITKEASYASQSDPAARGAIQPVIDDSLRYLGFCDYVHLFGWSASERFGDWGDYDHYDETVGGLERFRGNIARAQDTGIPVGLYIDGYLSSDQGEKVGSHAAEWAMRGPDGKPQYIDVYRAYNQCPTMPGWREHLTETYARVLRETGARGLYVDEYGATDGRWACYAKEHGHNGYEVPYAGEAAMLSSLREAVGPDTALYSEYPPAEVSRQYLDGSFSYQALWSVEQEAHAPHFIDLPRFAFPAFKQFHIIYYVAARDGNWWLLKFPFFNGESYDLGQPNLASYDAEAMAFQRRAIGVLCAHREAFASHDVRPLVPTEATGVFANEFRTPAETVYTLYNANGRSVRGTVLRIPHREGASYEDAWSGRALTPEVRDGQALVAVELPPKGIGCVAQVGER